MAESDPVEGKKPSGKHKVNVTTHSDDEDDAHFDVILSYSGRKDTELLLDNQATVSVFKNRRLFSRIWEEEDAIRIKGISKQSVCTTKMGVNVLDVCIHVNCLKNGFCGSVVNIVFVATPLTSNWWAEWRSK